MEDTHIWAPCSMGTTRLPTGPEYVPTLASTSGVPPAAGLCWGGAPGTVALALSVVPPAPPWGGGATFASPRESLGAPLPDPRGGAEARAGDTPCFPSPARGEVAEVARGFLAAPAGPLGTTSAP